MLKSWFLSLRPLVLCLSLLSGVSSAQQYIGSLSVSGIAISDTDTHATAHVTAVNSRQILVHTSSGGYWQCGEGLDTIYDSWFNLGGCRVPGSGSSEGAFNFTVKVFSSVNLNVPSGTFTLQVMPSGYAPNASTPVPFMSGADPDSGAGKDACCVAGQPINLTNGNTWVTQTDYSVPGVGGGLALTRTWNSLWQTNQPIQLSGMFGHSWRSNLEERIQVISSPASARYWRGDGTSWTFNYSVGTGYTIADPVNERATLVYDRQLLWFCLWCGIRWEVITIANHC